jgi:hypothetical protein
MQLHFCRETRVEVFLIVVPLILSVLVLVGMWGVFEKAGQPGWASIVPFYGMYVLIVDILEMPPVWFWLLLIPLVNVFVLLPLIFMIPFLLAEKFEQDAGFGIGLLFLPFIFYPILGLGDARYCGEGYGRYGGARLRPITDAELDEMPPLDPSDDPRTKDGAPVEGPPDEDYWEKYNRRLEFPLSSVATVLLHVLVGALLIFILLEMENTEDHSSVNQKFMAVSGMDDFGDGSAGSGGTDDPLVKLNQDEGRKSLEDTLADPNMLPEVRDEIKKTVKFIDPSGNLPITASNAAAINNLTDNLKKQLVGGRQGSGTEPGTGFDGSKGKGPGGTGANSTLGRNMRWTLRFKVTSGRDYLAQLKAMNAKLLIPVPGQDKCILIENIDNPDAKRVVTDKELGPYGDLLKFADSRREAVGAVAGALGLDFTPKTFFAVFTKEMESDLADKEKNYRNRRAEDIEETVFRVTVRGGSYEVVVDEQKAKGR